MTKAEEIIQKYDRTDYTSGSAPFVFDAVSAVNEAMEWAAKQCEVEAVGLDWPQNVTADNCAERIRAGKSQ
jgi:hypothetical protein